MSANAIVTNNRTPKGFSGVEVHSLGLPQNFYKTCTGFAKWNLPSFWWTGTKTAVPSPDVIVGGIPSCVSFGGIQLVWHLAELSKREASQTPLDVKPAIGLQQSGSSAIQFLVDSDCPWHPCHLGYLWPLFALWTPDDLSWPAGCKLVARVVLRLVSTQVLERCKFFAKGSHSLTLISEGQVRASYLLELKLPSPRARHHSHDRSAVSRVTSVLVYKSHYSTVKATAPSRVHIYCRRLKVTGRQWTGNVRLRQNAAWKPWVAATSGVSCGLAAHS